MVLPVTGLPEKPPDELLELLEELLLELLEELLEELVPLEDELELDELEELELLEELVPVSSPPQATSIDDVSNRAKSLYIAILRC